MQESVSAIPDLIAQLRDADPTFKVFGSKQHQYRLRPPQDEHELASFETANGCELPTDYREYLLSVADGGAGPYYGLESLKAASEYRALSKPFPFSVATESLGDAELDEYGDRDEYGGILELCHQGCAIYSYLVVCGPTYGTMWDGREDFYPQDITFAQWYCRWANQVLTLLANESLGIHLNRGMTTADVEAAVGGNWQRRDCSNTIYYESSEIPFQLEINDDGILQNVKPWPFITARPR